MNQLQLYEPTGQVPSLFDNKKIELLKSTICKGSTDDEFELFLHACTRTGLDPFMRQIYAVKRWDSSLGRNSMSIQVGIDGYRLIAERTGKYSPGKESTFAYDENRNIISSTSFVKKQTHDGTWHEVSATAFFSEYCQKTKDGRPTKFWMQMSHTMLSKCAEALALRKAFPGDLSGIYTKEEMMQATLLDSELDNGQETPKVIEPPAVNDKYINKDQWLELNSLIKECSSEFQDKIWKRLESLQVIEFSDLETDIFIKIKSACQGHINKNNQKNGEQS